MKPGRILVLALLVAALGAYLYFWELPKAEHEAEKTKLLDVQQSAITGVTLTFPDREIVLQKDGEHWKLVRPLAAAADDAAVGAVTAQLAGAQVQKTLDELPADLGEFGLAKPDPIVRVTAGERTLPEVKFGRTTAVGGKAYVRRDDEPKLLLVSSAVRAGLDKKADDLRDKKLLAFQDDKVTKVTIAHGDAVVTLARKGPDAWTVDPGDHPADPTEVRSYLSTLRSTRALGFADESPSDLAAYALDVPRLRVGVYLGGDTPAEELLLGQETEVDKQKRLFAKRGDRPNVVTVGEWTLRSLDKTVGQLRDKTVFAFDPDLVGSVTVGHADGAAFTLVRGEDKQWKFRSGEGTPQEGQVTRLLDDLRELRGSDVVAEPATDLAAWGLDAPGLRIAIADAKGAALGTVLLAKHGDKYYAMREGGSAVFETRDYMYARLDKTREQMAGAAADKAATAPGTAAAPPGAPPAGASAP